MNSNDVPDEPLFYIENGFTVFTAAYHLSRGYCCKNGCRHCPYEFKNERVKKKVSMSWSGGKDSAFALYETLKRSEVDVMNLHTVIDEKTRRVGLHGVPEILIEKQAEAIGLPLEKIYLPAAEDHAAYTTCMRQYYQRCVDSGIDGIVFGDIFLEDLKTYRINLLKPFKLFSSFPLWGRESGKLITDFIDAGFKSTMCSANAALFSKKQLGNIIDREFVASLRSGIDPCGENGEFHTFVFDGPLYKNPIPLTMGEVVQKTYSYQTKNPNGEIENLETVFWFQDLCG